MKKIFAVLAIAAVLVAFMSSSPRAIAQSERREAEAELEPPTPAAALLGPVTGEIKFFDNGTEITAIGEAEGLNPAKTYVSLVYDNGSTERGPNACEPTSGLTFGQMFLGAWTVNSHGEGTLRGRLAEYTPIGTFRTVSIRDTSVNGGRGPAAVAACGLVVEENSKDD